MRQLLVKSGIKQFHLFEKEAFEFFEAFLAPDDRLDDLLKTRMKPKVIHAPNTVDSGGLKRPFDLCSTDAQVKTASLKKLQDIVSFAGVHDVPCVVVHAGFFDTRGQDRWNVLDQLAQDMAAVRTGAVTVCFENVPCWVNLCFEREPVLRDEQDWRYLKSRWPKAGLTYDVDHAALNAVFQEFYSDFRKQAPSDITPEFRRHMEERITASVARDQ